MNNRKILAALLRVYQEHINELQCKLDDLEFASDEWKKVNREERAIRNMRKGALELAYNLWIIDIDEFEHHYGVSELIDKLEAE